MIVKHVIHGRAPLQKNQQHKENQDHSGQKVQAKASAIKISAQPLAARRSQTFITSTRPASVSSQQKAAPKDSLSQQTTSKSI